MLYLTCTVISSVDLTHYGVSRAKDWVPWIVVQEMLLHQFLRNFGCRKLAFEFDCASSLRLFFLPFIQRETAF